MKSTTGAAGGGFIGRALLLALLLSVTVGVAQAAEAIPTDAEGLPLWEVATWDDFPVSIRLADGDGLARLLAAVPIASFGREQIRFDATAPSGERIEFRPRVTAAEAAALQRAGYVLEVRRDLDREGRQAAEADWATQYVAKGDDFHYGEKGTWHTHVQIGTLLDQVATDHPAIARTFSWGTSVQGRELWGLVISADVDNSAAEPEVRLSSTMHGNEPVGTEMLLFLADYLTDNYGQTGREDVTALVDGYEIHLMPMHNPDGYVYNQRYNINGIDLNRNFILPGGTATVEEQENLAFKAWAEPRHFVISGNGHSGALVVNYPWDYIWPRSPDDAALQKLSLEYSTWNLPMYNGLFWQGITHGASWYMANGTLQDWSYDQTGCIDLTLELNDVKWPDASAIDGLWDDNRESLMHFIKAARYGVNGIVTDALTGLPLAATVAVTGNSISVVTDPEHGDYYKLLATGTYELTFTAEGYLDHVETGVSTTWGTPTVLDVTLMPDDSSSVEPPPASRERLLAYPNPFNPGTTLRHTLARRGYVRLAVYDLFGRRLRTLYDGVTEGDLVVPWDGTTDDGTSVPSGVYFARLTGVADEQTVKLMLVR